MAPLTLTLGAAGSRSAAAAVRPIFGAAAAGLDFDGQIEAPQEENSRAGIPGGGRKKGGELCGEEEGFFKSTPYAWTMGTRLNLLLIGRKKKEIVTKTQ